MPIPKPKSGEEKNDYISRCVETLENADPDRDHDQILGICYTNWRKYHSKEGTVEAERFLFFTSAAESLKLEDMADFDFDNNEVPILLADTKPTYNKTRFTKNAINEMKDRIMESGHFKIFSGHDMGFFSMGPGTRPPTDWVASINPDTLKTVTHKGSLALVGKIKVLGGTEERQALRESIKQDPAGVQFSVDVLIPSDKVKHSKQGEEIIQEYGGIAGFNSCDWVTYGAVEDAGIFFQRFSQKLYNQLKEVNKMTLAEFKELHPDEYQKMFDQVTQEVGAKLSEKTEQEKADAIKAALAEKESAFQVVLGAELGKFEGRIKVLESENKEKDKKIAKMIGDKLESKAEGIMDSMLSESPVKPRLFSKVKSLFDIDAYIKDDVLDEKALREAFTEELKTWYGEDDKEILGGGHSNSGQNAEIEKDIALGKTIFNKYFGKKNKGGDK